MSREKKVPKESKDVNVLRGATGGISDNFFLVVTQLNVGIK